MVCLGLNLNDQPPRVDHPSYLIVAQQSDPAFLIFVLLFTSYFNFIYSFLWIFPTPNFENDHFQNWSSKKPKKQQSSFLLWIWNLKKSDHTAFYSKASDFHVTRPKNYKIVNLTSFPNPFSAILNEEKTHLLHPHYSWSIHIHSTYIFCFFFLIFKFLLSYQYTSLLSLKSFFLSLLLFFFLYFYDQ